MKRKFAGLPLHFLVKKQPPPDVVKIFLEAGPNDPKENLDGNLPIHIALEYRAADEVIMMLFEANPYSKMVKNNDDSLPLHLACQYGASPDIVKLLYEKYEDAKGEKDKLQVRNNYIEIPLHVE
jgi:ankyrin repeat protein